ncbi:MAG: glycosyltransferase family 4 protein [Hyphomicrobiales bacterium]
MTTNQEDIKRKRILLIAPVMPAQTGGGLPMRLGGFLEAAAALGDVDVLTIPYISSINAEETAFTRKYTKRLIVIESKGRIDTFLDIIRHKAGQEQSLPAFAAHGRPSTCIHMSSPVLRDAAHAVSGQSYDLCIVVRLNCLPILEAIMETTKLKRVICDLDDDDQQVAIENAQNALELGDNATHEWFKTEAGIFRAFLDKMSMKTELMTISNPLSLARLSTPEQKTPIHLVENSISITSPVPTVDRPMLLFVGILNYEPNMEGLKWFFSNVWGQIKQAIPDVKMLVAGRLPTKEIISLTKENGVELLNDLPDITEAYAATSLAIVPLLSGSGTRIKILEAGAYGMPVVSTEKGAEGLALQDGEHGWIVPQDPDAFATACIEALRSPDKRKATAQRLRDFVTKNHGRDNSIIQIENLLRPLVRTASKTVVSKN